MDKINKNVNSLEDPDYKKSGEITMEKLNNIDISLTSSLNGQTKEMVLHVQKSLNGINRDNIWPHLPQLGVEEASARATSAITAKLKALNKNNPFLSEWNEITAKEAAKRIGIQGKKLDKLINSSGALGERLKKSQAFVSKEWEEKIKKSLKNSMKSEAVFLVSLETWLLRLIDEQRKTLSEIAPNIGKSEKGAVIQDSLTALIKILNFAPNQNIPIAKLSEFLLKGRLNGEINIVDLHCLSFINSKEEGILVSETAEKDGLLVGHKDRLLKIKEFLDIFKVSSINFKLNILLIDNDPFVMPNQEKRISSFLKSLRRIVDREGLEAKLSLSSQLVDPNKFINEWQERSFEKGSLISGKISKGEKLTKKLINEISENLSTRTLPEHFKTRDFAHEFAKRTFLVQFALGSTVPEHFEPAIILQNARAHQQATEIFRLGAKNDPLILTFWIEK